MRKTIMVFSWAFALMIIAAPLRAAEPLVDADWVRANLDTPGIVFLDTRGDQLAFLAGRVPGAVLTNYGKDGWRTKNAKGVVGMLPDVVKLEALIGSLGIDNDTYVVLTPLGLDGTEMGVATRIYWTFKFLGHDKVSILNGGLIAYGEDPIAPREAGWRENPKPKVFKANLRPELLATEADVTKALASGDKQLIDNRPVNQHTGATKSPVAKRYGTIPGSGNLPAVASTEPKSGVFKSKDELMAMSEKAGIDTGADTITYCNTGHWASVGWFISSEILGNKNVKMYDGSMAEWTQKPSNPLNAKVPPNPKPKK